MSETEGPTPMELLVELREVLGLSNAASTKAPKEVWNETLGFVADLSGGRCWACHEKVKA